MIQEFPINQEGYDEMLAFEKERDSMDIEAVKKECHDIAWNFWKVAYVDKLDRPKKDLFSSNELFEYNLLRENYTLTTKLLAAGVDGASWFNAFMTDWIENSEKSKKQGLYGGDMYSDSNFRLNLMLKLCVGKFVLRNSQLIKSGLPYSNLVDDQEIRELWERAQLLQSYINYLDRRNMPVFPANGEDGSPNYIPQDSYFMMGDNRFNSLDMRHSYEEVLTPLSPFDEYSVYYYTNIEPQFVSKDKILGTTEFRFWPKGRIGFLGEK